ncbi:hypothetical protein MUK42_25434 [Musa troglodytarum]|uniref:Uncharacterized protein n=1 Tax=Musa troglodytarum TaxID=320322 RepID=A0A9E7L928_9LILI|nr:hypothetical protein MUK42_25434 [Musa troglodytarum]
MRMNPQECSSFYRPSVVGAPAFYEILHSEMYICQLRKKWEEERQQPKTMGFIDDKVDLCWNFHQTHFLMDAGDATLTAIPRASSIPQTNSIQQAIT